MKSTRELEEKIGGLGMTAKGNINGRMKGQNLRSDWLSDAPQGQSPKILGALLPRDQSYVNETIQVGHTTLAPADGNQIHQPCSPCFLLRRKQHSSEAHFHGKH